MRLSLNQTIEDFDTTEISVHDTERANYILAFWKPSEEDYWYTEEIEYGTDADTFRARIRDYYRDRNTANTDPEVTLSCRDYS